MIRLLLVCLSFFFFAPAAFVSAQTREQKLDAVKEFKRFFRKWKGTAERVESVLDLKRADCPEAVDALVKVLRHKDIEVREAARNVLAGYRAPATIERMLSGLVEMKDATLRGTFIDVLSRGGSTKLKAVLREIWEKDRKSLKLQEKFQIARALKRLGAEGFEDILLALTKDKAFEVRLAALDAIGESRLKKMGKDVVPMLNDPVWQVQQAAIQALGTIRYQGAVNPLIEKLKDPGRLKIDIAEALFKITTWDFGTNYKLWRKTWDRLSKLEGFRIPTDAELAKAKKNREKYDKRYKKGGKKNTFAGIPTTSTRVLFVIDVSASMDDLVIDRTKFKGYRSFRKLDIVKTELSKTVKSLGPNTWFNIIAFASKIKKWKKFLVPGTVSYKASALSFIKSLEPLGTGRGYNATADGSGKTNTYGALMAAFDLDPAKGVVLTGNGKKKALKLDTIYFLTDGRPSIGKYVDIEDILREVKKINETRRIVIHCISIGDFEGSFLKRLAQQNGGVFVDLGH